MSNSKKKYGIVFIFECLMAVFYLIFGITLLFTSVLDYAFYNKTVKIAVGILFGIYGIFRIFRSWKQIRDREQE
jgi:uncharacterized membrane protein